MKITHICIALIFLQAFSIYPQSLHVITIYDISLKAGPKATTEDLLNIPKDTNLEVLNKEGDYYKVEYNNTLGYVFWGFCYKLTPSGTSSSINKKSTNSYSSQCQAITKKGRQCSRKAQFGSNYCWQHQR